MAATVASTSLAVTLAHAVSFLTAPLATALPSDSLAALQTALEAALATAFAASWAPAQPLRGSGRRVLSFAPRRLPPRPVYAACAAAGVSWDACWGPRLLAAAGNAEFDLFVDPGCVAVRQAGAAAAPVTVWSADLEAQHARAAARQMQMQRELQAQLAAQQQQQLEQQRAAAALEMPQPKTLAQRLMEADRADDDALFELLADEMRAPTWMTPVLEQFPGVPTAAPAPVPAATYTHPNAQARAALGHSRSSSRSSVVSSSAFSFLSDESATSCGTLSSVSSSTSLSDAASLVSSAGKSQSQSRRERARQARVFIDTSRNEVTPYDGGKTTVLTGGVMLGAPAPKAPRTRRF